AENCIPLPENFSPEEGVLLETLGIAIHSVDLASLKPGQTIAILGAGPIGLLTAAVARASGAAEIYMTEPVESRQQFALDFIADVVLDPYRTDIVTEILELTRGRGVDVAFEAAGASGTPAQAAEIVRPGGKVIVAGIPSDDTMTIKAGTARRKGLTIKMVRRMKHTYPRAIRMVQTGMVNLKPLISRIYSLDQIIDAYQDAAARADGILKAMIRIG
ncbi:MAG: zinc-binding dehydrogenase, partial [Anaerolineales bacterium]|nr:zinc-binding dehydrogenase [Anaerolineales bacterium]